MSYPQVYSSLRTDEDFRNREDEDHHKKNTPLVKLPIDLVEDIIIADSLHLLDLGIMRKCLHIWIRGSNNYLVKFSGKDIDGISARLEECNLTKPKEINRRIRGLKCLKFWKGAEFRTVLLYVGVVVFKDFLPHEVYEHFFTLLCAVTILSSNEHIRYCTKFF